MNQSLVSRNSGQTAATGKGGSKADTKVSEVEITKEMIDYKNDVFNEVVEEI